MTVDIATGRERPSHTRSPHAIRLLVLLDCCGEAVVGGDLVAAVKVVGSELRLQAMDFWMRNPDYLMRWRDRSFGLTERTTAIRATTLRRRSAKRRWRSSLSRPTLGSHNNTGVDELASDAFPGGVTIPWQRQRLVGRFRRALWQDSSVLDGAREVQPDHH